jgi:hypothetical protein
MSKQYITYEEAVSLLPDGEYVHTFYNCSFGLLGADWSKEEILNKLRNSEVIQLTGNHARAMNHGMCAYNKDTKWHSEILFIETDAERLNRFDGGEED